MTVKQQILSKMTEGKTLAEAVEEVVPGADPKLWKRAIHWQATGKKSQGRQGNSKRFNYAEAAVKYQVAIA